MKTESIFNLKEVTPMSPLLKTQMRPDAFAHVQVVPQTKPVQIAPIKSTHGTHHHIAERFHHMSHMARINEMKEQRKLLADITRRSNHIGYVNFGGALACAVLGTAPALGSLFENVYPKLPSSTTSFINQMLATQPIQWIAQFAPSAEARKECEFTKFGGKSTDYLVNSWNSASQSENKASEIRLQSVRERSAKALDDWRSTVQKLEQALQDQHSAAIKAFP